MPSTARCSTLLGLALLLVAPPVSATEEEPGEKLIAAAQRGDVEGVRSLLEAGTPVDSTSRYGTTALFHAVDKGNLELVSMLIEAGADVNVRDTFYGERPLGWALYELDSDPAYREIVLRLLEGGAEPADRAVERAVREGDLELLSAALATGRVTDEARREGISELEKAEEVAGAEEMIARLAAELPAEEEEPEPETVELSDEERARYVGFYANDELGLGVEVVAEGGELKARLRDLVLVPTGGDRFRTGEDGALELEFGGRDGVIEGFALLREDGVLVFDRSEEETGKEAVAAPLPEPVRLPAIQWPSFRGPGASGIADGQGVPTRWNGEGGTNVLWKTEIPGTSLASPVIWGERVFVATAVSDSGDESIRVGLYGDVDSVEDEADYVWRLYALDRRSGEILWQRDASRGRPQVKRHMKSSHANSTPAADDRHVVVLFPSEGLFCFDHDGNLLWQRDLGVFGSGWFFDPTYEWGFASSPILHDGRVIVQADIYGGSFLAAWDLETGEEIWRSERDEIPSWATPTVLPGVGDGPDEIVTNAKTIRGYDAATGEELWTLGPNSEIVVGTPVVGDGLVYVTGGYPPARPIYAIRPGGRGDLTLTDDESSSEFLAWHHERGGTYIPTPIAYEDILYLLNINGRLAAYDAATGELIYRERVGGGGSFSSSPIAADGRLFFTAEDGTTTVVRSGRVYAELAENALGEPVMATPAATDGLLVLRGLHHVFGIGSKAVVEPDESGG